MIGDLRKEVYNLQQLLLKERLQTKALSEELENPLNYHRWRKLEGTDQVGGQIIGLNAQVTPGNLPVPDEVFHALLHHLKSKCQTRRVLLV